MVERLVATLVLGCAAFRSRRQIVYPRLWPTTNIGRNGIILNLFAVGAFVLGHGQQQRCAVGQVDGLLHRTFAEGALANTSPRLAPSMASAVSSAAP